MHFQDSNGGSGVYLMSPQFVLHAWQKLSARSTNKTPTSGFIGILWALQFCGEVKTYGFGKFQESQPQTCESGSCPAPRKDPGVFRYFKSGDERPWAFGHKWGEEDSIHQSWFEGGILTRRFS
mmetsp:Transcript_27092/g.42375  ORF Transcript_27092/g.42375 Transcript_27092/m.42375 type:complete len:123 (-) Transcript_27092:102-470(-)